jgi:hypothetical protein
MVSTQAPTAGSGSEAVGDIVTGVLWSAENTVLEELKGLVVRVPPER